MTIDQIANRLALPRTTVYGWVRELPVVPVRDPARATRAQRAGTRAMQAKYQRIREDAYREGLATFAERCADPTFRDFLSLYLGEGSKRCRNDVALCNSDPRIVCLADRWIRRLSDRRPRYALQYHADQDVEALRVFWGRALGIPPGRISLQRKSNSGQLSHRAWRSRYGVLTVGVGDTRLRACLQGWLDALQASWALDSLTAGA